MHVERYVTIAVCQRDSDSRQAFLNYVDIESLAEARSAHQDEPGIVFDRRRRSLEICWTGWVGRNFQKAVEAAFEALCPYT